MGGITLNTLVCGLLYHPVEQHMIKVPIEGGIDNQGLTIDEPVLDKKKATGNIKNFDIKTLEVDLRVAR